MRCDHLEHIADSAIVDGCQQDLAIGLPQMPWMEEILGYRTAPRLLAKSVVRSESGGARFHLSTLSLATGYRPCANLVPRLGVGVEVNEDKISGKLRAKVAI